MTIGKSEFILLRRFAEGLGWMREGLSGSQDEVCFTRNNTRAVFTLYGPVYEANLAGESIITLYKSQAQNRYNNTTKTDEF